MKEICFLPILFPECILKVEKRLVIGLSSGLFLTNTQARKAHWHTISGQKHAKSFLDGTSAERTAEFVKFSRLQARQMAGLLRGHCHLKEHFFKLGEFDNPICRWCHREIEMASDTLCDCEVLAEF
jgi:hypothetical protein